MMALVAIDSDSTHETWNHSLCNLIYYSRENISHLTLLAYLLYARQNEN